MLKIFLIIAIQLLAGFAQAATLSVCHSGCGHSNIQAAIDAASPGDIIEVRSGTYNENIAICKQVTINGIDTGRGRPSLAGILYLCGNDKDSVSGLKVRIINSGTPESDTNSYGSIKFGKPNEPTESSNNLQDEATWNSKGTSFAQQGKYDDAIIAHDKAIEINSQYAEAWNNKGFAFKELGNYDDAILAYDNAIKINPQYAVAWNNKGSLLIEIGKYEEAILACDNAIRMDSELAEAWNNKGCALNHLGKYDDATNCLNKALQINPEYVMAWNNKGFALTNLGKYEEAILAYNEAIARDPEYVSAWNNRGVALNLLGLTKEADFSFAKAKELENS